MNLLIAGPPVCPECGGARRVGSGFEYSPGFLHEPTCCYRQAPKTLADLGARRLMQPHIQNWLLDEVRPLVDAYLAAKGTRPTRLLIAPRYRPLYLLVGRVLGLEVVGDLRCRAGELFLAGPDWDGRLG